MVLIVKRLLTLASSSLGADADAAPGAGSLGTLCGSDDAPYAASGTLVYSSADVSWGVD